MLKRALFELKSFSGLRSIDRLLHSEYPQREGYGVV